MNHVNFPLRSLAAAALLCTAAVSQAAVVAVATRSAFQAIAPNSVDAFSDLTINTDLGTTSLTRSAGTAGYTVSSSALDSASSLYVVPVAGSIGLSTVYYGDSLTFSGFGGAFAFGGNFYGTNILGEVASGGLTIAATDVNGSTLTTTLAGNSATGFAGFRSDAAISNVVVRMTTPNTNTYVTADNVAMVPEPSTSMLVLAGGGVLLLVGARRRA